jgi:mono/diheme cytochrome c family protein
MRSNAKQVVPTWWKFAAAGLASVVIGSSTLAVRAEQAKTTKDAVYSEAQAKRGEDLYNAQCASCHASDLSGGGAPALAGADFLGFWDKTPTADLVEKIQASMPANSPGSLTRAQSADITAFMFKANKFPAGAADLTADAAALKGITITK